MMKKQTSATFALAGAIAVAGLLGAGAAQAACEDDWMDVARWVAGDVKAGVVAGDTWPATDPVPYPDEPGCAFCVHNYLQTRHGIVTQENLALTQLADDKTYVFAYIYSPSPIRGGTGSHGSPIAVR